MKPSTHTAAELERYLSGGLDPDQRAAIERAAEEDVELGSWLRERQAERDAFRLDPRRRQFASLIEEAGAAEGRGWLSAWLPRLSILAAATAVVVFFVKPTGEIRTKGSLSVRAAVLEDEHPTLFDGKRALHPGDRLRLAVDDPKGGYVTVLLQEQGGKVEVLYRATELGEIGPGTHHLPGSLELDQALGRERLYVLVSEEPPDVDVWIRELESVHRRTGFEHGWLPAGETRVSTIEYEKVRLE
jgi:hypothetical protein